MPFYDCVMEDVKGATNYLQVFIVNCILKHILELQWQKNVSRLDIFVTTDRIITK